jgi:hypothetical protein
MIFSQLFAVAMALLLSTVLGAPATNSKNLSVESVLDFSNAVSVAGVIASPAAGSSSTALGFAHGYCTCKKAPM